MTLLRYGLFLLAVILYPPRLLLFVLHSCAVFLIKPGARVIVPLASVGVGAALHWTGYAWVEVPMSAVGGFFRGFLGAGWGELAYQHRGWLTAVFAFFVLRFVQDIAAAFCRPLVLSLPPPRRPFLPLPPLFVPAHVIRVEDVRQVVQPVGRGRFGGDMSAMIAQLPPEIRSLFEPNAPPAFPAGGAPVPPQATVPDTDGLPPILPQQGAVPKRPAAAKVPGRRPASTRESNREGQ